jgi:hypothetical protein
MKKIIKIITVFFLILIILFIIDFINNYHYKSKFESIKPNTHLKTIESDWGSPDISFIYKDLNNSIIYKYKKDYIGWETYLFVFNPKDSLLVSKNIDD